MSIPEPGRTVGPGRHRTNEGTKGRALRPGLEWGSPKRRAKTRHIMGDPQGEEMQALEDKGFKERDGRRGIKENDEGVNSTKIDYKQFCKSHNVPPVQRYD
jgi:hypothetical protein